ncbi:MAG: TolC family protein [Myxococcales bacterium]|nr:TolC family protein [Myxococcales bacterium]
MTCLLGLLLSATPSQAAEALTEDEVIRLARARAPASAVAGATASLADAQAKTAGRLPNPELSWAHESLLGGPPNSQDILMATVPIEFAGPLATRALAESARESTKVSTSLMRTDASLDAVLVFYDAVAAARRVEILEQALANLDEAARVLARREKAGSASGYESTRLVIASELTRSQLAETRGVERASRARLAYLLNLDERGLVVDANLTLAAVPDKAAITRAGTTTREAVTHARAAAKAAETARARARWTWLPTLSLGGGPKFARIPEQAYGYALGVSLSLPVFNNGQRFRAEARAQRALAVTRAEALTRTIAGEIESLYATYETARAELERFDRATARDVEGLLTAAQSGYTEGERTIVELLDAQRARTAVAERRLELLLNAKRAELRVRAAGGMLR